MKSDACDKIFAPKKLAPKQFAALLSDLSAAVAEDQYDAALKFRNNAGRPSKEHLSDAEEVEHLRLSVCYSLLADFMEQGWRVRQEGSQIFVSQPSLVDSEAETVSHTKRRIRKSFEAISNRQLNEPTNREFIRRMESERQHNGQTCSIKDLIDDGADLAASLSKLFSNQSVHTSDALDEVIKPQIVECRGDEKCPFTGLRLQDIWRYFRHTWSLEYKLLPGRTMRFLVRNAARKNQPIIGIALLSSPTANLLSRDKWIGWTLDSLAQGLMTGRHDAEHLGQRLFQAVKDAIREIRTDDLVPPSALNFPKQEHFFALDQLVHEATMKRAHDLSSEDEEKLVDIRGLDKQKITNPIWKELSATSLYVKKRAEQLIPLLKALRTMKRFGFDAEPTAAVYEALMDRDGKSSIQVALNEIKKVHLASEVADLSVCGAVAPYNKLIGGKLVTALMASEEVRSAYRNRYGKQVSEIASQIKGRRVTRSAELKVLTTTALYGVGSNQYSSLVLRKAKFPDLQSDLVWRKIDSSEGFTVTHISDHTVELMRELGTKVYGRRRINSVFGEGSSPRTRQIREGLNLIGINNDALLRQANRKKVYVCEIYPGAKDEMLGFNAHGNNAEPANSADAIARSWASRWLGPRLTQPSTLEALASTHREDVPTSLATRMEMHSGIRSD